MEAFFTTNLTLSAQDIVNELTTAGVLGVW
jgi:hypothetical protein